MTMDRHADLPLLRRQRIAERLQQGQAVASIALAEEFRVSEDVIRRDLRALAAEGQCKRVYGGALPLLAADQPVSLRATEGTAQKQALASVARGLIAPGQTLFLDTGSTTLALAGLLPEDMQLRVITNSLPVAAALMERRDLWLYVIGGVSKPEVGGCVDARALADLQRFRFDLCFLGACAMSEADGLTGFDMDDVDFKRSLLNRSDESILMMTNTKIGSRAPFQIGGLSAVSTYILEPDAPAAQIEAIRAAGSQVRFAETCPPANP